MVGWHHRLSGHEFEQTLGDDEGQESLTCSSPWGPKESDMTEQLNLTDILTYIGENKVYKVMIYLICFPIFSSVQLPICVPLFVIPWTTAGQASLLIDDSQSSLNLKSTKLVMPFNRLFLCCPLLLLPSIFPSIRVFSNESVLCIRWPNDLTTL